MQCDTIEHNTVPASSPVARDRLGYFSLITEGSGGEGRDGMGRKGLFFLPIIPHSRQSPRLLSHRTDQTSLAVRPPPI